jgi:hypothetical protein
MPYNVALVISFEATTALLPPMLMAFVPIELSRFDSILALDPVVKSIALPETL